MKTILFFLLFQWFFLPGIANERNKKQSCPNFSPRVQTVSYHPIKKTGVKGSHRAQLRRNTPSSCRKKRRTGEVQHFLKIQ
jgi:hypothetical protein